MKHRPSGSLTIKKAVEGFLHFKTAEGLSPNTITSYRHDLGKFIEWNDGIDLDEIDSITLSEYIGWLRTDYKPRRFNGSQKKLSPKTVRNHWVSLCSFFRWYSEEFGGENPMKRVPSPKAEANPPEPFTKDEIKSLLDVCLYARKARTHYREAYRMRRSTGLRDRAILLVLLDSGLRSSEFCSLNLGDFEIDTGKLIVKHGREGGAKGGKGRIVYLGKGARKALWRYLVSREEDDDLDAPLFLGKHGQRLTSNSLRQLTVSLGERAEVKKCHPHRFRHTFAITYLRAGGDIFTLQSLLGHRSLDMVRHYARVAQIDVELAHRKASPVDNWRL